MLKVALILAVLLQHPCVPTPLTPAQAAANYAWRHPVCRKNTGWTYVLEGEGCAPRDTGIPFPPCPPKGIHERP